MSFINGVSDRSNGSVRVARETCNQREATHISPTSLCVSIHVYTNTQTGRAYMGCLPLVARLSGYSHTAVATITHTIYKGHWPSTCSTRLEVVQSDIFGKSLIFVRPYRGSWRVIFDQLNENRTNAER